jgi:UDP-N-acetylmuramoyl-tripeptide--D-alanyl-D-alanine ligase
VNTQFPGVSTDSRTVKPGELFVALKGDNFNGHDFVMKTFEMGAAGAIISEPVAGIEKFPDRAVFLVSDTLKAMGDLARHLRRRLSTRIIGITGSNGKTTTKEMTYHLLSKVARVSKAQKSFNNFVGVPLTIFAIEPGDEYAVIEMGANAPGEIKYLAGIALPDIGVITTVTATHLEGFKSEAGVANAKAELLDFIRPDSVGILNADNPWTATMAPRCRGRVVTFGRSAAADVRATDVSSDEALRFKLNGRTEVTIPMLGEFNVYNALAAAAVGIQLGMTPEQIAEAFKDFSPPAMRLMPIQVGEVLVINDAYNANPTAMRAAMETFVAMKVKGRKVFVFGDMRELGEGSEKYHREMGKLLAEKHFDLLMMVGPMAAIAGDAAAADGFPADKIARAVSSLEAAELLPPSLRPGDTVLLKGSRAMALEKVIEGIKRRFAG